MLSTLSPQVFTLVRSVDEFPEGGEFFSLNGCKFGTYLRHFSEGLTIHPTRSGLLVLKFGEYMDFECLPYPVLAIRTNTRSVGAWTKFVENELTPLLVRLRRYNTQCERFAAWLQTQNEETLLVTDRIQIVCFSMRHVASSGTKAKQFVLSLYEPQFNRYYSSLLSREKREAAEGFTHARKKQIHKLLERVAEKLNLFFRE